MKTKGLKFVYRLVNDENEVVYVGKTESLPTRTNQHFSKNSHLFPRFKKDDVTVDYNISRILDLLNKKKPTTETKALYHIVYWRNGKDEDYNRDFAFAYCDDQSNLILNTSS